MSATAFGRPTGLLGATLSLHSERDKSRDDALFQPNALPGTGGESSRLSFIPTGLLGTSRPEASATNNSDDFSNALSSGFQASSSSSTSSFRPTGLLSPLPPTAARQDHDQLPTISQAFNVPETSSSLTKQSMQHSSSKSAQPSGLRYNIRATTFDGRTLFIKRRSKLLQRLQNNNDSSSQRMNNLLEIPIHRLMDSLASQAAESMNAPGSLVEQVSNHPAEDTLWVDRYKPHRFAELIGNERVARETMAWVKQWDWCVFGKKKNKGKKRSHDDDGYADEYHRPKERILLLSGPPGLGKTTLAHVIAKQAGYEVLEVNASDARSAQVIDDRIRPALESGSAVGSTKPVLLVIDEIDGATGTGDNSNTFVNRLVQLTYDKPRRKARSGQRNGPNSNRPLLRPIICICNDVNASSLTKLRPIACQMRMQRPPDVHTVKRLREICQAENLRADSRALSALVGIAKGDLRGCINTLQFIKSRSHEVTEPLIRKATSGMKESDASITSAINDLFIPLSKNRVKELGLSEDAESRYVGRLSREVDSCGKDSTIAVGCFAHYATLRQHDANFQRYERADEWLMTFDAFSTAMYSDGDFALNQYLPYLLVPFYPLFNERGGRKVERSSADWDNFQATRTNEEIYKSLGKCLQTASTRRGGDFRHLVSTPTLQLEFAPYINRIISPPLRPINSQIIKPEERAILSRLVSIMTSLELRFLPERAEDGQLSYRLDPPIDVFVTYDGKRAADISVSRYAVRRLVGEEVEMELAARHLNVVEKEKRGKHDAFFGGQRVHSTTTGKRSAESDQVGPANKRARTEKQIDIADRPPTDFFGRLISNPGASGSSKPGDQEHFVNSHRVSYKFSEGNSAAVRKPVKMISFL